MSTHARALSLAAALLAPLAAAQSETPPPSPAPATPAAQTSATAAPARTPDPDDDALSDRRVTFGAAIAPAALPAGSVATYVFLGVPELGAGARQGFGPFELEGRAKFDYLKIAGTLDLMARVRAYRSERLLVAPFFGTGVHYDTGVTYADAANFNYFAVRLLGGAVASYGLSETVRAIGVAELPIDLGLSPGGAFRVTPLIGGGAEFYVGEDYTLAVLGQVGGDFRKDPAALLRVDLGYHLRIALGYRLF